MQMLICTYACIGLQAIVPVKPTDTPKQLAARVLVQVGLHDAHLGLCVVYVGWSWQCTTDSNGLS